MRVAAAHVQPTEASTLPIYGNFSTFSTKRRDWLGKRLRNDLLCIGSIMATLDVIGQGYNSEPLLPRIIRIKTSSNCSCSLSSSSVICRPLVCQLMLNTNSHSGKRQVDAIWCLKQLTDGADTTESGREFHKI